MSLASGGLTELLDQGFEGKEKGAGTKSFPGRTRRTTEYTEDCISVIKYVV